MADTFDEVMNAIKEKENKTTSESAQTQPAPSSNMQTNETTVDKNNSLHSYSKQFEETYGKKK